jgi:hypothetical protein
VEVLTSDKLPEITFVPLRSREVQRGSWDRPI